MNKDFIARIIIILILSIGFLEAKIYKVGFAQDTLVNDWRKAQVDELIYYSKEPLANSTIIN